MNGDIHPAVGVEIYSKFTDGGIRQCQDALHAAKGQDAKGCRFIVAAQIEAFVEDLAACFDGFGAEQLIQPFSRPDGQPCRKFLSQLTQHPLTGVDRLLVLFPQARFLPLDLVDLRQPDGTQLRSQATICSPNIPTAAAMGVSGQGYVRVLCVQKMRRGAHLHVFKGSAYDVRCDGIEGLLACLVLGLALHHLPQAKDHAADDDQHNVAAQNDACDGDHTAHQRKEFSAQFAALAFAKLPRQMFIRHVPAFFFHILLLILSCRSARDFPLSDPADCPYRSARR